MEMTLWIILIGTSCIGMVSALVGSFTFIQGKSLIGDAVSHSILPGIVLGYLLAGTRNNLFLFFGAFIAGFLALQTISWLLKWTKLKSDSVIALTLSFYFALGLVGLSYIQGNPEDSQAGLGDFLFGKIATLTLQDIALFFAIGAVLLTVVYFRFRTFLFFAFNEDFMVHRGFSKRSNDFLMNTIIILTVTIGVQAVGVVLMSALLILPIVIAKLLIRKFKNMVLVAVIIGCVCSLTGSILSVFIENLPTGPCIILVLFAFLVITSIVRYFVLPQTSINSIK